MIATRARTGGAGGMPRRQKPSRSPRGNAVPKTNRLQPGELAPDFTLPAETGAMVTLSDFRGRADVVLFFYAKDNTAVCSAEACSFRDSYQALSALGAVVIGISADSAGSHRRFAGRFQLPFTLLSDADGAVRARYRVSKTFGLIPGRATFVIDKQGIVRHVYSSQFQPGNHPAEAIGVLKTLRDGS
jgi:peroxiredoxin Q/BCP